MTDRNARPEELRERLLRFIRDRFIEPDAARDLTADTPLLAWGILDSLRMVVLIQHIRSDLGLPLPPPMVTAENLQTVETIVATIMQAAAEDAAR